MEETEAIMGQQPREERTIDEERVMNIREALASMEQGEIAAFSLERDDFQDFLENPSMELAIMGNDGFGIFRNSPRYGYTQGFAFDRNNVIENPSGLSRFGSWPINVEFIEFITNIENIYSILLEHGVENAEILSYTIIAHVSSVYTGSGPVPPGGRRTTCIWIHTTEGDFFLESNLSLIGHRRNTIESYLFFTLEEYRQRWGQ